MENNNLHDELLIRYLVNELNAEEIRLVEIWISTNQENRRYFEDFKNTWLLTGLRPVLDHVLDVMDVEDKWSNFKQGVAERPATEQPVKESALSDTTIRNKTINGRFVWAAVAASVILLLGLAWKFLGDNNKHLQIAKVDKIRIETAGANLHREFNTSGKEKTLQLPDGSIVVLANGAEINYPESFAGERNIILSGKAFFKVAKDKTRPFTVSSGDISTTAVGTEFSVTTYKELARIIVRLYEGKVLVREKKMGLSQNDSVYLLPGQQFVYNKGGKSMVGKFRLKTRLVPEKMMYRELSHDNPSVPDESGSWYMFNNQSLPQVFEQLSEIYNAEIIYNKKEIENLYFIGKFDSSASLDHILQKIGKLNQLTVTRKDNQFIINK